MAVLLGGCGAGGGTGDPPPGDAYAVDAALKAAYTDGFAVTLSGDLPWRPAATGRIELSHAGASSFGGAPTEVWRMTSTGLSASSGASTPAVADHHVQAGPRILLAIVHDTGEVAVVTAPRPMPQTARPGDGGPLGELQYRVDGNDATDLGALTWSLTAIDASSAWYCLVHEAPAEPASGWFRASTCHRLRLDAAATTVTGMRLVTERSVDGVRIASTMQ